MPRKRNKRAKNNRPSDLASVESTARKFQSLLVQPEIWGYMRAGMFKGLREKLLKIDYTTIRNVVDKVPLVGAVINTRIDQVVKYAHYATETGDTGYEFYLRDRTKNANEKDEKMFFQLADFLDQTGIEYDSQREDDFADYLELLVRETLTIDQIATELQRNRVNDVIAFWLLDGATIKRVDPETFEGGSLDETGPNQVTKDTRFAQMVDYKITNTYTDEDLLFDYKGKRASLRHRGFGYCLPEWTRVLTDRGYVPLSEIFNDDTLKVWDGETFCEAERIDSSRKRVRRVWFENGSYIDTSEDHRFKIVQENGSFGWKPQKELRIDDYVVSYKSGDASFQHEYTIGEDVAEVLGWLYSDGTWTVCDDSYSYWRLYYSLKDMEVVDKHEIVLKEMAEGRVTRWKTDSSYGAKGDTLYMGMSKVIRPFERMGFSSRDFSAVAKLPFHEIAAFLRGVFSANGYVATNYRPEIKIVNESHIRTLQLLLSQIGIDSVIRAVPLKGNRQDQWGLVVISVAEFRERVGFIHEYKTKKLARWEASSQRLLTDRVPVNHVRHLIAGIDFSSLPKEDRHILSKIRSGVVKHGKTFSWLSSRGIDVDYRLRKVVKIETLNTTVQMCDLRIINGNSQFVAEGVYVHNSPVEMCIDVITTLLFGYNYLRDQLMRDRVPKGFIQVMGDVGRDQLDAIREYWYAAMSGAGGQWNIPIVPSGKDGVGIDWKNIQPNNREMEYHKLMMFLSSTIGAVFGMDMAEMGIKTDDSQSLIGASVEPRIESSKNRGLGALLAFIEQHINKILRKVNEDYKFRFVGLEREDETKLAELRKIDVETHLTVNEIREAEGKEPLKDDYADVVLNPQAVQLYSADKMAKQQAEMGGGPGEEGGEEEEGGFGGEGEEVGGEEEPEPGAEVDWESLFSKAMKDDKDFKVVIE